MTFTVLICHPAAGLADTEQAVEARAAQERYFRDTVARWRSAELDLLILPGFACPPPPREKMSDLMGTSARRGVRSGRATLHEKRGNLEVVWIGNNTEYIWATSVCVFAFISSSSQSAMPCCPL